MTKKLQLTIKEPCHENWESMSPAEKGRFCGSCRKQVIDFSCMDDRQIAEFFKRTTTGSLCGRFLSDQLDRDIVIPRKRIPWVKYFFSLLIPAFFISRASGQRTMGKPGIVERDSSRVAAGSELKTLGMVLPTTIMPVCADTTDRKQVQAVKVKQVKVNGQIVDELGSGIPHATVTLLENGKIIQADGEGRFSFIAGSERLIELLCTSVGYQPNSYIYPFTLQYSSELDVTVQMKKEVLGLPEVVIATICDFKKRQYTVGGVTMTRVPGDSIRVDTSKKVQPGLPKDDEPRFYPNPVKSGQSLYMEVKGPEEGYYRWVLADIQGKIVQTTEVWIDTSARLLEFRIPFLSSGTYIAMLVNKKSGKRYSAKIIVD